MAEVKETKKIKVMAAAFPSSGGANAKAMKEKVEAAGFKDFKIQDAAEGYIAVIKEVDGQDAADKLITEAAGKGITLVVTE